AASVSAGHQADEVVRVVGALRESAVGVLDAADGERLGGQPGLALLPDQAPRQAGEPGSRRLDGLLERGDVDRPRVAQREGLLVEAGLHLVEQRWDAARRLAERGCALLAGVAAGERDVPGGQVARADLDADRHALELPARHPPAERQ